MTLKSFLSCLVSLHSSLPLVLPALTIFIWVLKRCWEKYRNIRLFAIFHQAIVMLGWAAICTGSILHTPPASHHLPFVPTFVLKIIPGPSCKCSLHHLIVYLESYKAKSLSLTKNIVALHYIWHAGWCIRTQRGPDSRKILLKFINKCVVSGSIRWCRGIQELL